MRSVVSWGWSGEWCEGGFIHRHKEPFVSDRHVHYLDWGYDLKSINMSTFSINYGLSPNKTLNKRIKKNYRTGEVLYKTKMIFHYCSLKYK